MHDAAAQNLPVRQVSRPRLRPGRHRGQDEQWKVNGEERGVLEERASSPLPYLIKLEVPDVPSRPRRSCRAESTLRLSDCSSATCVETRTAPASPMMPSKSRGRSRKQLLEGAIRIHGGEATP